MKRLFFTIFLWFWLTLVGVGVIFLFLIAHAGLSHVPLGRLMLHDLLLFSLAGAIFCYFISSYLTKPLHKLSEAASKIAEGRLDTRVDPAVRNRRDEIAGLARNFDRMAERIEALVTGQRRLLGDVSHELRSPLARLMVALSLVKRGPAEEAAENLDRIGLEAHRLDTLIGQLLTLTRIDSEVDRGSPARFDLANLVQEVANDADFEARAHNRRVIVKQSDECTVEGFEELHAKRSRECCAQRHPLHCGRERGRNLTAQQHTSCASSRPRSRARRPARHAVRNIPALPPRRE